MIDMKKRASVELGSPHQFSAFIKKAVGMPVNDDQYFSDGTDVDAIFRFLFPFARLLSLDTLQGGYVTKINYAVFRSEEDAVEFKLKYL